MLTCRWRALVERVDVEAGAGDTQPPADFVKTLSGECALEVAGDSKYALGLKARRYDQLTCCFPCHGCRDLG